MILRPTEEPLLLVLGNVYEGTGRVMIEARDRLARPLLVDMCNEEEIANSESPSG